MSLEFVRNRSFHLPIRRFKSWLLCRFQSQINNRLLFFFQIINTYWQWFLHYHPPSKCLFHIIPYPPLIPYDLNRVFKIPLPREAPTLPPIFFPKLPPRDLPMLFPNSRPIVPAAEPAAFFTADFTFLSFSAAFFSAAFLAASSAFCLWYSLHPMNTAFIF